jgi:hypothetical protein
VLRRNPSHWPLGYLSVTEGGHLRVGGRVVAPLRDGPWHLEARGRGRARGEAPASGPAYVGEGRFDGAVRLPDGWRATQRRLTLHLTSPHHEIQLVRAPSRAGASPSSVRSSWYGTDVGGGRRQWQLRPRPAEPEPRLVRVELPPFAPPEFECVIDGRWENPVVALLVPKGTSGVVRGTLRGDRSDPTLRVTFDADSLQTTVRTRYDLVLEIDGQRRLVRVPRPISTRPAAWPSHAVWQGDRPRYVTRVYGTAGGYVRLLLLPAAMREPT